MANLRQKIADLECLVASKTEKVKFYADMAQSLVKATGEAIHEAEEYGRRQEREMCKFIVTQSMLTCDVYLSEFGTIPDGLTIGQAIMIAIDDRDKWLADNSITTEESQGQPAESG